MQKGYHVGLFAVFGWLLSLRLIGRSRTGCVLWVVAAGVVAEALQLLVAGRHPHIGDAVLREAGVDFLRSDDRFGHLADYWTDSSSMSASESKADVF